MKSEQIKELLQRTLEGELSVDDTVSLLAQSSIEFLTNAKIDLGRELRSGFEEVVFAERKSWEELNEIVAACLRRTNKVLVTRIPEPQVSQLQETFPELTVSHRARLAYALPETPVALLGTVAVVSAGTSDAPVAEEAALCAQYFGLAVTSFNDVGVAGLERLTKNLESIRNHDAIIVVAGMEGALASVLAGLCEAPILAVPTSVGYGASLGGITTLFSMLISCSPGISVVNIDNGFGAALTAAKTIRHLRTRK